MPMKFASSTKLNNFFENIKLRSGFVEGGDVK